MRARALVQSVASLAVFCCLSACASSSNPEPMTGLRIDDAFLNGLHDVTDPVERAVRIDEILTAYSSLKVDVEEIFPFIGELRTDLRAASWRLTRTPRGDLLSDSAQELLAYWGDPADGPLLEAWLKENRRFRPAPQEVSAPTPNAMCAAWAAVHFQKEGAAPNPPPFYCKDLVIDTTGTRALMLFEVSYAHWSYNMHLLLVRPNQQEDWHLQVVEQHMIT